MPMPRYPFPNPPPIKERTVVSHVIATCGYVVGWWIGLFIVFGAMYTGLGVFAIMTVPMFHFLLEARAGDLWKVAMRILAYAGTVVLIALPFTRWRKTVRQTSLIHWGLIVEALITSLFLFGGVPHRYYDEPSTTKKAAVGIR